MPFFTYHELIKSVTVPKPLVYMREKADLKIAIIKLHPFHFLKKALSTLINSNFGILTEFRLETKN